MIGNVAEWVHDEVRGRGGLRGGAWNDPPHIGRASSRHWAPPHERFGNVGFRCAHPSPADTNPPGAQNQRPEDAVSQFYARIDRREFAEAWTLLTPSLQGRMGSFETWIAGYQSMRSTSLARARTRKATADEAVVDIELGSVDERPDGVRITRRYEGTWSMRNVAGSWLLDMGQVRVVYSDEPLASMSGAHPEDAVRRFYGLVNARRFGDAWLMLTPSLRSRFGSFDGWMTGYANTVSTEVMGAGMVTQNAGKARVAVTIRSVDRAVDAWGGERKFAGHWDLRLNDGEWRLDGSSIGTLP